MLKILFAKTTAKLRVPNKIKLENIFNTDLPITSGNNLHIQINNTSYGVKYHSSKENSMTNNISGRCGETLNRLLYHIVDEKMKKKEKRTLPEG